MKFYDLKQNFTQNLFRLFLWFNNFESAFLPQKADYFFIASFKILKNPPSIPRSTLQFHDWYLSFLFSHQKSITHFYFWWYLSCFQKNILPFSVFQKHYFYIVLFYRAYFPSHFCSPNRVFIFQNCCFVKIKNPRYNFFLACIFIKNHKTKMNFILFI